jgi:hypothetical protein
MCTRQRWSSTLWSLGAAPLHHCLLLGVTPWQHCLLLSILAEQFSPQCREGSTARCPPRVATRGPALPDGTHRFHVSPSPLSANDSSMTVLSIGAMLEGWKTDPRERPTAKTMHRFITAAMHRTGLSKPMGFDQLLATSISVRNTLYKVKRSSFLVRIDDAVKTCFRTERPASCIQ